MTNSQTKRLPVQFCSPVAGDLYRKLGEDEELFCYDWVFRVTVRDGRVFEHKSHAVRGAVQNPEGFWVPNFNARREAEAFALKVEERGSIDPAHWFELSPQEYDLEAALAEEAAREQQERGGW